MKPLFLIFFFLLIFSAITVYSLERNPHEFKKSDCMLCHELDAEGRVNPNGAITLACEKCHSNLFTEGYMHPVDVRPEKITVPKDMPLSARGYITCNTCHDVHSPPVAPDGDNSHYLRRYERGKAFCDSCHGSSLGGSTNGHQAILGEVHFRSKYIVTDPSQPIDAMSKNCITCHDGAFASSVTINSGVWKHLGSGSSTEMNSHPIGVQYESARLRRGRRTDLRPLAQVDRRILFFEGKVGCGSCHNPYSKLKNNLVMSNERSRLCLACHMVDR